MHRFIIAGVAAVALLMGATPSASALSVNGTSTTKLSSASTAKLAGAGITIYAQDPGTATLSTQSKLMLVQPITVIDTAKKLYKSPGAVILVNGPAQRNITLTQMWIDWNQDKVSALVTSTTDSRFGKGQRLNIFSFVGGTPTANGLAGAKLYLNASNNAQDFLNSVLGTTVFVKGMRVGTLSFTAA